MSQATESFEVALPKKHSLTAVKGLLVGRREATQEEDDSLDLSAGENWLYLTAPGAMSAHLLNAATQETFSQSAAGHPVAPLVLLRSFEQLLAGSHTSKPPSLHPQPTSSPEDRAFLCIDVCEELCTVKDIRLAPPPCTPATTTEEPATQQHYRVSLCGARQVWQVPSSWIPLAFTRQMHPVHSGDRLILWESSSSDRDEIPTIAQVCSVWGHSFQTTVETGGEEDVDMSVSQLDDSQTAVEEGGGEADFLLTQASAAGARQPLTQPLATQPEPPRLETQDDIDDDDVTVDPREVGPTRPPIIQPPPSQEGSLLTRLQICQELVDQLPFPTDSSPARTRTSIESKLRSPNLLEDSATETEDEEEEEEQEDGKPHAVEPAGLVDESQTKDMVSREETDLVDVPADRPAVLEQETEEVQPEASQSRSRLDAPDTLTANMTDGTAVNSTPTENGTGTPGKEGIDGAITTAENKTKEGHVDDFKKTDAEGEVADQDPQSASQESAEAVNVEAQNGESTEKVASPHSDFEEDSKGAEILEKPAHQAPPSASQENPDVVIVDSKDENSTETGAVGVLRSDFVGDSNVADIVEGIAHQAPLSPPQESKKVVNTEIQHEEGTETAASAGLRSSSATLDNASRNGDAAADPVLHEVESQPPQPAKDATEPSTIEDEQQALTTADKDDTLDHSNNQQRDISSPDSTSGDAASKRPTRSSGRKRKVDPPVAQSSPIVPRRTTRRKIVETESSAAKKKQGSVAASRPSRRRTPQNSTRKKASVKKIKAVKLLVTDSSLTNEEKEVCSPGAHPAKESTVSLFSQTFRLQGLFGLGVELLDSDTPAEWQEVTHLVVKGGTQPRRTPKLMVAMCRASYIVSIEWIRQCLAEGLLVECDEFAVVNSNADADPTKQITPLNLERAQELRDNNNYVLAGHGLAICKGVAGNKAPQLKELQSMVEAAGADWLGEGAPEDSEPAIVITNDPPATAQKRTLRALSEKITVKTTTWLFDTMMSQKLDL
jgi:hypothetical protein